MNTGQLLTVVFVAIGVIILLWIIYFIRTLLAEGPAALIALALILSITGFLFLCLAPASLPLPLPQALLQAGQIGRGVLVPLLALVWSGWGMRVLVGAILLWMLYCLCMILQEHRKLHQQRRHRQERRLRQQRHQQQVKQVEQELKQQLGQKREALAASTDASGAANVESPLAQKAA